MTVLEHILDRLEMRRMAAEGYTACWCTACFATALHGPKPRREFVDIWPMDRECRQEIKIGTISECIASFRERQAEDRAT